MGPRLLPAQADLGFPRQIEGSSTNRHFRQALNALREEQLFGANTELRFGFDRETRRIVVWIIDAESNEVLRQIPSEEVIQMARVLDTGRHEQGAA